MDSRLRLQPKRGAHFLERGWHAMIPEITVNELKQLVLALGKHLPLRSRAKLPNS
jgi:hypothetical protein